MFRFRAPYQPFYLLFFSIYAGQIIRALKQEIYGSYTPDMNRKNMTAINKSAYTQLGSFLFVLLIIGFYFFSNINYKQKPYLYADLVNSRFVAEKRLIKHIHDPSQKGFLYYFQVVDICVFEISGKTQSGGVTTKRASARCSTKTLLKKHTFTSLQCRATKGPQPNGLPP